MSTRTVYSRFHRILLLLLASATLALGLVACGSAPAVMAPTAEVATSVGAATAAPTSAARPTVAPTTVPTSAPTAAPSAVPQPTSQAQPTGVLPAALIYNMGGQIYRLAVDGTTTTKLTDESPFQPGAMAITEFDVSPADGSLVYLTQQVGADNRTTQALIRANADGTNRTVLLEGSYATAPRFSPDGTQIAFGVIQDEGDSAAGLKGGVYVIPAAGGTPQLVQANDPFDAANPVASARAYAPSKWSPDGSKLLLRAFLPRSEFCETVIKDLGSAALIKPSAPEGSVTGCGTGVWSADSRMVYLPLYEPGMFGVFAGLAQVDVASGTLTPLIGNQVDSQYIMINGLLPTQDGSFLGFVATSATPFLSEPPNGPAPRYTLHQISLDGRITPLRSDSQVLLGSPVWAPDASGAVIPIGNGSPPMQTLVWVPIGDQPTATLVTGELFGEARWGR